MHFDFPQVANKTHEQFLSGVNAELNRVAKLNKILIEGSSVQFQLKVLIEALSKKKRVVVLVDEYDKPIINNLDHLDVAKQNHDLMRDFFGTLKSLEQHLKFTFFTGVNKFSQVSLFSGLNNLIDITMNPKYASLMGYTEREIERDFKEHIQEIAKDKGEERTDDFGRN